MKKNRWQKIQRIFNNAVELPAAERQKYVETACENEKGLYEEIWSLISADDEENDFLNRPVFSLGAKLLEADEIFVKSEFTSYQIKKLLGLGGMGTVYLAEDKRLERNVALKILPSSLRANEADVMRFRQEARAASAISHPNVAHIYDFGEEDKIYFLAMEYVEGKTLRELLSEKAIDLKSAVEIAFQIADALDTTHQCGIVHRDIKPENVIVTKNGLVKVLDFGVAKLFNLPTPDSAAAPSKISLVNTTPGMIMGTINYISPEQLQTNKVDFRADIWSLGVVLYEMLAGRKPFESKTPEEIGKAILKNDPAPLSFPALDPADEALLKKVVVTTLQKDIEKRYRSAAELVKDLKTVKQNMEFNRQFTSGEILPERFLAHHADTNERTKNSTALTVTREFWTKQSPFRKVLLSAAMVSLLLLSVGGSAQYFRRFYVPEKSPEKSSEKSQKLESFSSDSLYRLKISTLFDTTRRSNGAIRDLNFSPDSQALAFTLLGDDSSDIYISQLTNGESTKITDGQWKYQSPLWSRDGERLVFVSNRDNKPGIWSMPMWGGTPIFQTSLEDAGLTCYLKKWSNDGKRIYYESCKKLYALELDSGKVSEIPVPDLDVIGDFNISNDEKTIAFAALQNQKRQIFTRSLEEGEIKAVSQNEHDNWSPAFFPDKQRIAYSSDQNRIHQIYVSDLTGGEPSPITLGDKNATYPVVSPDGSTIVYVSENDRANIFSLDLKTGEESWQTMGNSMQLFPAISSDQKMVFQTAENDSGIFNGSLKIMLPDVQGKPIININLTGGEPQWSPGNGSFAYLRRSGTEVDIWKADVNDLKNDPNDRKEKSLTRGGITVEGYESAPYNLLSIPFDWSPDGKKIVYSSKQSGFYNIWTIDKEGNDAQMLTQNSDPKLRFSSALWSPSGDRISYIARNQLDQKNVRYGVSVLSNGETRNLFESDSLMRLLGWSQNEKTILAAVKNENNVGLIGISTTSKTEPSRIANLEGVYIDGMALSPDGKKIAYSARRNGINNVFVFSIDGKEKQVTSNTDEMLYYSGITWSPDGSRLYYSKQSGGIQISMISESVGILR